MTMYYSSLTKGFYDSEFNYPSLPDDVIQITPEEHLQLLSALNIEGKEIEVVSGNISLKDKVRHFTWDEIRAIRDKHLQNSDYTQALDYPGDKQPWIEYRQLLRDIPQTFESPNDVVWPIRPG